MTGIGPRGSGVIGKRVAVLAIALGSAALAAPASGIQASRAEQSQLLPKYSPADPAQLGTAADPVPPSLGPNVRLEPCKEAKPGGMCGTSTVPLDRLDPSKGTLDLFFVFFPHAGSAPTSEAILITEGGPGFSVTQDEFLVGFYRDIFDPLMKTRDLIMLDQRGVGRSGAIDCPELQHGSNDVAGGGARLRRPARAGRLAVRQRQRRRRHRGGARGARIRAARLLRRLERRARHPGLRRALPGHLRSAVLDSPARRWVSRASTRSRSDPRGSRPHG